MFLKNASQKIVGGPGFRLLPGATIPTSGLSELVLESAGIKALLAKGDLKRVDYYVEAEPAALLIGDSTTAETPPFLFNTSTGDRTPDELLKAIKSMNKEGLLGLGKDIACELDPTATNDAMKEKLQAYIEAASSANSNDNT